MAIGHHTLVAFATTCRGRSHHLKKTLPRNIEDNASDPYVRFVVLDYSSKDDLLPFLSCDPTCVNAVESGRLIVASHWTRGPFQMAHSKNMAHRIAIEHGADIVCNMDADNYAGRGFSTWIREQFIEDPNAFLWAKMIQRCNTPITDGVPCILPRTHEGDCSAFLAYLCERYDEDERPLVRGISGRLALTREAFIKTGGYDEKRFAAWGPDDRDLNRRLQSLGYTARRIPNRFLDAIHHGPKLRFKEYPHAEHDESAYDPYDTDCQESSHTAVVNFGRIGCGGIYGHAHKRTELEEIKPIPTRIFGVGFHKTGTTSLCGALRILGIDCAHWTSPRWARDVWREMREYGKSLTLERHYAATDLPLAPLYRELDRAYPGSKFILTVRDENRWIRSVEDHWCYTKNPWRITWDMDCFSHRMHREIYGRKDFHAEIFMARYRMHNYDVTDYFYEHNRYRDLLILDVSKPNAWQRLCEFLELPIPNVPFPKLNVS